MNQMLLQMKDMQSEINQLKEKKDVQYNESSSSVGESCGVKSGTTKETSIGSNKGTGNNGKKSKSS